MKFNTRELEETFFLDSFTPQTVSLQVKYKEDVQKDLSSALFSSLPQTLQTELAKEVTELQSQVTNTDSAGALVSLDQKEDAGVQ